MAVGWSLPAWGGISLPISQRAAWKSSMVTIAWSSEVCTHWPLPGPLALEQRDQDALGQEDARR